MNESRIQRIEMAIRYLAGVVAMGEAREQAVKQGDGFYANGQFEMHVRALTREVDEILKGDI